MKRIDFVKMGFKNLWRRKLRTILTTMGVVIGTFSIVIMVSLGVGMTEGYKEEMAQWLSSLSIASRGPCSVATCRGTAPTDPGYSMERWPRRQFIC